MTSILESISPVIAQSEYVTVNQAMIAKFAEQIQASDLKQIHLLKAISDWGFTSEELIAFVIILEALNFSYWGEPKWAVTIDGQEYDGFYAMFYSLKQAKDKGYPILTADFLANLSANDLRIIWQGNTIIPLFNERLEILRNLGKTVMAKFDGRFSQIIERSLWDAEQIVSILAQDFPDIFNDVAEYQGQTVQFFKRAQLVPAHLLEFQELGLLANKVINIDKLTAFADYKVPQALRKLGILEYAEDLADKVDNLKEIISGSEEEIEIRANTIWTVELLTQALKEKFLAINSAKVDELIWLKGQIKSPNDRPYHHCRTIWY